MDSIKKKSDVAPWPRFYKDAVAYSQYDFPKVSVIIPTFNCAQAITLTLDSVLSQNYSDYEVIIIDGSSTDATIEVIKGFHSPRIQIHSMTACHRYEMINRGISLATGTYVNFIFPGDLYLQNLTFKHVMSLAVDNSLPDLVYGGSMLRDEKLAVRVLFRSFALRSISNGLQPTSLESCWFKKTVFESIGKFGTSFLQRGGFDLLCRVLIHGKLSIVSTSRVLTDYDARIVTHKIIWIHFWETATIVYTHFGLFATLSWWWHQKDLYRFFNLWLRQLRIAFIGKG